MRKPFLHIQLLKYLLKKDGSFGYVEIEPFLSKKFPDEKNYEDRRKMKNFLTFLSSEQYIEIQNTRGIIIVVESGQPIHRSKISAIIKIKPKGVELIEHYSINTFNKTGIVTSIFFGITTLVLSFYTINREKAFSEIKEQNSELRNFISNNGFFKTNEDISSSQRETSDNQIDSINNDFRGTSGRILPGSSGAKRK